MLEANLSEVRSYKESIIIEVGEVLNEEIDSEVFVISTSGKSAKFKCSLGKLGLTKDKKAIISAVTATALKLKLGDNLRYVTLKKKK